MGVLTALFLVAVITEIAVSGPAAAQDADALGASALYQGAQASDAFSAIHNVGGGRIIAGKRCGWRRRPR